MKRYRRFRRSSSTRVRRYRQFPRSYAREIEAAVFEPPAAPVEAWPFIDRLRQLEGYDAAAELDLRDTSEIGLREDARGRAAAPRHAESS
jgi:hypothetical protein